MAKFITSSIKRKYEQVLADLRGDIGREVVVIRDPTSIDCPNCGYDQLNDRSNNQHEPTDPYPLTTLINAGISPTGPIDFPAQGIRTCPVCRGKGTLSISSNNVEILCLINPLTTQDAEKTPLGKNYKFSFELQTTIDHRATFMNARKVLVDGVACEVVAVIPTGIGDITQINVYVGGGV